MTPFRPKHVAVFSLWAEKVVTVAHFYRDIVRLSLLPHHDHQPAFVLGHGSYLVINRGQPVPARNSEPPDFPLIAFAVEDLDTAIEHLEVHGIELPWGVETDENSRWVKFRDPAGNLIEFVQFDKPMHP
ncbi:MAG: VOC family protein [Anaerolineales bacterium]|jgi:catechol-2,3-dioxygenase